MIGRTLSHYKILSEISRGGMGIVYRALDLKLDREVALKVLPPELVADPERKRRFVQEAKAAAKLEHPHIGVVYEIDETDGVSFIAMELIRGEQLRDTISRGSLPLRRSLEIATDIAEGLAKAHDEGIVHRDLKPANIMVTEDGHTKIIDFGLAKLVEPLAGEGSDIETLTREETVPGKVMGTVSYMSPEQARGQKLDHRSDIFGLGVVLQEMLTGHNPFRDETGIDTLHAILKESAPRLEEMGQDVSIETASLLQALLDKCLAKDAADRYQNCRDLITELRNLREEIGSTERQTATHGANQQRRWWIGSTTLGVALLGMVLGWFLLSRNRTPPGIGASGRPAIAVMYFEDHSGSEEIHWLSKGVPSMLLTDLAQTPGLDVVSSERIHEVLRQIGHDNLESIDKSVVAEVARRAGAGAVVVGSIFKSGAEVRIDVQVEDVATGRILSAESVRGEDIFPLMDELTGRIRGSLELGDRPASRSLAEVTTPSLEAFRFYSQAMDARSNQRWADARKHLEEAVRIDPSFAMAYYLLSEIARYMGESDSSRQYREKALEHLGRLPERQKMVILAQESIREGKYEEAVDSLETLLGLYPDEENGYFYLHMAYYSINQFEKSLATLEHGIQALPTAARLHNQYGYELLQAGRYLEAIHAFETYAELKPEEANPLDSLAEAYLVAGQPEKALENYARALEKDAGFGQSHVGRAWAFTMLGRYEDALDEWARAEVRGGPTTLLYLEAFTLTRVGRYREAEEKVRQGIEVAASHSDRVREAQFELLFALSALERENYETAIEATRRAEGASELGTPNSRRLRSLVAHLLAGVAEARRGNLEAARAHLDFQRQVVLWEAAWDKWFFRALEGEVAFVAGDLDVAENAFTEGAPKGKIFFAAHYPIASAYSNNLPFRDGLARVKKARDDLDGAIAIYRKLITPDMSSKWTSMLEPRYVLELARLLDKKGDTAGASAEYERFLELWKDADAGLPELEEARQYLMRSSKE